MTLSLMKKWIILKNNYLQKSLKVKASKYKIKMISTWNSFGDGLSLYLTLKFPTKNLKHQFVENKKYFWKIYAKDNGSFKNWIQEVH